MNDVFMCTAESKHAFAFLQEVDAGRYITHALLQMIMVEKADTIIPAPA